MTKKSNISAHKVLLCAAVVWTMLCFAILFVRALNETLSVTGSFDFSAYMGVEASVEYSTGKASGNTVSMSGDTITLNAQSYSQKSGCTTTYYPATVYVKLKNTMTAGSITVNYTLGDSLGTSSSSVTLEAGQTMETPFSLTSNSNNATAVKGTIKITGVTVSGVAENVGVTFAAPAVGSYTAETDTADVTDKIGTGEAVPVAVGSSVTLKATVPAGYVFSGWYVNGTLQSRNKEFTATIVEDSVVEALIELPFYSVVTLAPGSEGTKADYVTANLAYNHRIRGYHTEVGQISEPGAEPEMVHDGWHPVPIEDPAWSISDGVSLVSSASGHCTGDYNLGARGQSNAAARMYSDIIQIKCEQPCIITFRADLTANPTETPTSSPEANPAGVYLYYLKTPLANVGDATITTTGTAVVNVDRKTSGGGTASVTMSAGDYLYIFSYGMTVKTEAGGIGGLINGWTGYAETDFSYSSTISNIVVTPNESKSMISTGCHDNTGKTLTGGSVIVDGVSQNGTNGIYTGSVSTGATVKLRPGTAPAGYKFIGWHNVDAETYDFVNEEYSILLSEDGVTYTVNPIYVPAMAIKTGGNYGYVAATYTLNGKTYETGSNPYFVARKATATSLDDFYTDLNEAFTATDKVVLLADHSITGNLTIPSGKTMVIPCHRLDEGSEIPIETLTPIGRGYYVQISYDGAMTVEGSLIVGGQQNPASYGIVCGGIGYLNLDADATVAVSGGLYASGHIRGGRSIDVSNGGIVRETFQVLEIPGNNAMLAAQDAGVFPFSNFAAKNIESTVNYAPGATLYGHYSMRLQAMQEATAKDVVVIGSSGALFNLAADSTSGISKRFDFTSDKTVFRIDKGAKVTTGSFLIEIDAPIGKQSFNSKDFLLPMNAGFGFEIAGELTVASDFKFLPGAFLSVEKGGVCTVNSGNNLVFYRLNDYDTRNVGNSDTLHMGYSLTPYGFPVVAPNLPTYDYSNTNGYNHPTLSTVGSATLHVDGEMIVNGGLYVTNDPVMSSDQGISDLNKEEKTRLEVNQEYFAVNGNFDNGFNVLTGTGVIKNNMTSSISAIKEMMQASGFPQPVFDEVSVVPVRGLPVEATTDTPAEYAKSVIATTGTFSGAKKVVGGNTIYVWGTNRIEFWNDNQNDNANDDVLLYTAMASSGNTKIGEGLLLRADGTVVTTITDPVSSDRIFRGWNTNKTAASGVLTSDILNNNFSVYASDADVYAIMKAIVATVDGTSVDYLTLKEKLSGTTSVTVQMLNSLTADEPVTINCDVVLDLKGCDIPNVTNNGTVYGYDTATNAYEDGVAGTIALNLSGVYSPGGAQAGKQYVAVPVYDATGETVVGTEFHRVSISVTGMQIALDTAANTGYLNFRGTFRGDSKAADKLTDVGFKLNGGSTTWFSNPDTSAGESSNGTLDPEDGVHFYYSKKLDNVGAIKNIAALMELSDSAVCESANRDVYALLRQIQSEIDDSTVLTQTEKDALNGYISGLPTG